MNFVPPRCKRTTEKLSSPVERLNSHSPSADSWEPHLKMMLDVLDLVKQYDKAHPSTKKSHGKTNTRRVCGGDVN